VWPLFASADGEDDESSSVDSSTSTATFATAAESIGEKLFAELDKMKKQFSDLTESLSIAKEREEKAKGDVKKLTEEKFNVESGRENFIAGKKRILRYVALVYFLLATILQVYPICPVTLMNCILISHSNHFVHNFFACLCYSDEMTDLSDQLEGVQDNLRDTMIKTKSEISNIQDEARQSERRLKNEIAELESRLQSLHDEADDARKERDELIKQIEREENEIRKESRKEMEEEKKASFEERKTKKYKNWELESRIRQFTSELPSAKSELKKEEESTPKIQSLKETLESLKQKMSNKIDELKDQRLAKEMFYEQNTAQAKSDLAKEMDVAKSVFEKNMALEEENLDRSITEYEKRLADKENELLRNLRLATERADRAVVDAITAAKNNRIALYQEKLDAVQSQRKDRAEALEEANKTRQAVQDLYDAEYEDAIYNLKEARARGKAQLAGEDLRRDNQRRELIQQMEILAQQLTQQLIDEKAAGETEFARLMETKTAKLAGSRARTTKALNEIATTRSNLASVRDEIRLLEQKSEEKSLVIKELEEERASFRKQFRRTMAVAVEKLTFKRLRNRKENE
jgi:hypothetical protein